MKWGNDLRYLAGALRDGCLSTEWTIVYIQKNREWLTQIIIPKLNSVFEAQLNHNRIRWQKGAWRIKFRSKRIWKKLKKIFDAIPKNKTDRKFYIRGFWDAEGGCPRNPIKGGRIYIKFTQKDKNILERIRSVLKNDFKIKCGNVIVSDRKKNGIVWRFSIENKDGISKFCSLIGSSHPEKKIRLEKLKLLLAG